MRKLLNTLFVTSENKYLSLENENIVIWENDQKVAHYPLTILESIVSFSYKGASPALMGACAERNISLTFMTPNGRFLARSCGMENGNVILRRTQYRYADQEDKACQIARNMIMGKIYNSRWILERYIRDHAFQVDVVKLQDISGRMVNHLKKIAQVTDLESLRGLEGNAASDYFSVFNEMILIDDPEFIFEGRNRRPPHDNINALLSFAYSILSNDCASALESVGLDAYVGFLHTDRPGRKSMALDLMEELRGPIADRLVLNLINNRMIRDKHFDRREDGSVFLNAEGKKILLTSWQNRKKEELTHPYLKEKIPWGLVPYVQSLLLSCFLRGDIDGYPPFFWK